MTISWERQGAFGGEGSDGRSQVRHGSRGAEEGIGSFGIAVGIRRTERRWGGKERKGSIAYLPCAAFAYILGYFLSMSSCLYSTARTPPSIAATL